MTNQLFTNVRIFDGTGRALFPGEVLIEGNRIASVAEGTNQLAPEKADTVIDGQGMTLMPGMTEGHCHMSFIGVTKGAELGETPPEEHTLATMHNARLLLDHGFTSVYAAASAKPRLDVVIRNEVDSGRIPGPRIRAASPEITVTAGLGDERRLHLHRESFALIADGVDEIRRVCRMCVREGVDNLKINISGDEFVSHCKAEMTVMMDDEIAAAVTVAHDFGKQIACHARAANSVKRAVKHGVDVIYHCDFADEEALDMLESVKDRIFVGPAVGLLHNTLYEAEAYGITREVCENLGFYRKMEATKTTYHEMRRRGIRVVPGGDYGFAWTPQGTNARDLEHFVNLFGYTPTEALVAATRLGGELMAMGDELGLVKEGYLADLLLVRGNPVQDVSILQHQDNLAMIMKDGAAHKLDLRPQEGQIAAE
ncbi:MAG: amidohydrolase family protein [Pseudomonadota bacterium]